MPGTYSQLLLHIVTSNGRLRITRPRTSSPSFCGPCALTTLRSTRNTSSIDRCADDQCLRPSGAGPVYRPVHGFRCAPPVAKVCGPSGANRSAPAPSRRHLNGEFRTTVDIITSGLIQHAGIQTDTRPGRGSVGSNRLDPNPYTDGPPSRLNRRLMRANNASRTAR